MDVDLFNAVGQTLGVKVEWQPAKFDSIITGVQGGKYDIGVSRFTINAERKQQVNMVSYFNAGTQWADRAGQPEEGRPRQRLRPDRRRPEGHGAAGGGPARQGKKCTAARQAAINDAASTQGQDQATAAVASGKADAMLADSPVVAYAVKQSGGKLEAIGDIYDSAPYGYVVPKDRDRLRPGHRRRAEGARRPPAATRRSSTSGASRPARSPTSPSTP